MSRIERGAVEHLDLVAQHLFQFALLARGELFVENDEIGAEFQHEHVQFFQLAAADEGGGVGCVHALGEAAEHLHARGGGQHRQLGKRIFERKQAGVGHPLHAHQHGAFERLVGGEQAAFIPPKRSGIARRSLGRGVVGGCIGFVGCRFGHCHLYELLV